MIDENIINFLETANNNKIIDAKQLNELINLYINEWCNIEPKPVRDIREQLDIMSFSEACIKYSLSSATLRVAANEKRLRDYEYRKSGGTNLVTDDAMKRLYGNYSGRAKYNRRKKDDKNE